MRTATVIVAAIAAASIFIALAFIVSGGRSEKTVTKTVVLKAEAKRSEPGASEGAADAPGGQEAPVTHVGGPSQCGTELSVEGVSCEVGEQVIAEYKEGHRGDFFPKEGVKTVEVTCSGDGPVECRSKGGGVVYFGG